RTAERARTEQQSQQLRDEIAGQRQQREAASERLVDAEARAVALAAQVNQAQTDLVTLEAAHARRQVERSAREALRARIRAELATTRTNLDSAGSQREHLARQATELSTREAQLIEEVQATLRELAPMDEDFSSTEQRRLDTVSERRTLELGIVELRTAERLTREDREEQHVQAQRAADDLERLRAEIAEMAELESDAEGGPAWAEQLRLDTS